MEKTPRYRFINLDCLHCLIVDTKCIVGAIQHSDEYGNVYTTDIHDNEFHRPGDAGGHGCASAVVGTTCATAATATNTKYQPTDGRGDEQCDTCATGMKRMFIYPYSGCNGRDSIRS